MKRVSAFTLVIIAAAAVSTVRGGHELPIYPSFYPHEIEIRTLAASDAADALRKGRIQAYVGAGLDYAGAPAAELRTIDSLGSFVTVGINPQSQLAAAEPTACAAIAAVVRGLAGQADFILHPYPVTPFHGDYLHHADLAAAAKAHWSSSAGNPAGLKVKPTGTLKHPDWSATDADWDVEVAEGDVSEVVASATLALNGWITPPWLRTGWYHAERLLADAPIDPARRQRVDDDRKRLMTGDYADLVERVNLERDLVTALTGGCRKIVAGYTVKREYVNVEFSAGIENIGYDSLEGLRSPMFIRTVKLKDFPWNGWLSLGTRTSPTAAWNPIAGLNDPFGRLIGAAVSDPALLPSPYEAGWMLNRVADLPQER